VEYEVRAWVPSQHPRAPKGSTGGGQFAPASGGQGQAKSGKDTRATPGNANPVGLGERGRRVHDLQERLNALGAHLAVDGIFGPKTLAAVRAFQQAHGLKVDGLVGPHTTAALRGHNAATHHHKPGTHHHHHHKAGTVKPSGTHPKAPASPRPPVPKPAARKPPAEPKPAATRALTHEPLGKPGGPGLFHHKGMQLPAFVQHIAKDLMTERGMPMSEAIATAISQCKKWAAGGADVHPDTRAKAAAAIAEWERLKASAHAKRGETHAKRGEPMTSGFDEDGLDSSWDNLDDLPDLAGLTVADFEAADPEPGGVSRAKPKLGSGARFKALKAKLAAKGIRDPGALAAHIGRRKYGKKKFTALAAKARKGGGGMHRSAGELMRIYPLEDIRVLTRADGDGSGTVVEGYATVFDQEAEIHDAQGHYREVIDRGAFDHVLARISRSPGGLAANVKVLFNHGRSIGGQEVGEFQLPLGKPLDIRPEQRGLLTRTEYDASDPFTERILSKIRGGTITAQSFVGGIMRSDPELRGPGDRYRGRNGALTTVRRMVLGLREYGPVLYPAYSGAEILGVRMNLPGAFEDDPALDDELDTTGEDDAARGEGDVTGDTPEEVSPTRDHAHRLLVMRTEQMCREAGITTLKGWAS